MKKKNNTVLAVIEVPDTCDTLQKVDEYLKNNTNGLTIIVNRWVYRKQDWERGDKNER